MSHAPRPNFFRAAESRQHDALGRSHAPYIPLRWLPEQTTVFATELGRALVTHQPTGVARVDVLVEHQLPGFLEAKLFLELQRTGAGDHPKVLTERRRAHVRVGGQLVHLHGLFEISL